MNKRILTIIVLFLFLALLAGGAYAQSFSSSNNAQYITRQLNRPDFQTIYNSNNINTFWPQINDPASCFARQDIILQIPPGGCQPDVVRSDLLAEQDVPVFCQVDALKINPLIDISSIERIEFTGEFPPGVIGANFHPARAALRSERGLLGSPIVNNIGYVVIVLSREANESALPDLVKLNLTARIRYDSDKAFGVGKAEFLLNEQSDLEWELGRETQTFAGGRFSVRLEDVEPESARVTIYQGSVPFTSVDVERGGTSREIFLPNSYCQAGLTIKYDGMFASGQRARIEADGDSIEVLEGSKFLNGKCSVSNLVIDELDDSGFVELKCGREKVRLNLESKTSIQTGDDIIPNGRRFESNTKSYTKGYVSIKNLVRGSESEYLIAGDICEVPMSVEDFERVGISNLNAETGFYSVRSDAGEEDWEIWYRKDKKVTGRGLEIDLAREENLWMRSFKGELIRKCEGKETLLEKEWANREINDYFDFSIDAVKKVIEDYPFERSIDVDGTPYYGELVLEEGIKLAGDLDKRATELELRELFVEVYPDSSNINTHKRAIADLKKFNTEEAEAIVNIDNEFHNIRLISLHGVDEDSVNAEFNFRGNRIKVKEGGKYDFITSDGQEAYFYVKNVDAERVGVLYDCPTSEFEGSASFGSLDRGRRTEALRDVGRYLFQFFDGEFIKTLRKGETIDNVCGERFTLIETNIDRIGKVRIVPKAFDSQTITQLSLGIGIEKRDIKLNPEKSKEKIDNLQESIDKWNSISDNLGDAVTGLKGACFATGAALTVKNFFSGLDGSSLARQKVMRGDGGWNERCDELKSIGDYSTKDACFLDNADEINGEVDAYTDAIGGVNDRVESTQVISSEGFFGDNINTEASARAYAIDILDRNPGARINGVLLKELISDGNYNKSYFGFRELRDIDLNLQLENSGNSGAVERANRSLGIIGRDIIQNQKNFDKYYAAIEVSKIDPDEPKPYFYQNEGRKPLNINVREKGKKYFSNNENVSDVISIFVNEQDAKERLPSGTYYIGLRKMAGGYSYEDIIFKGDSGIPIKPAIEVGEFVRALKLGNVNPLNAKSYRNRYVDPKVKYFETGGFKGLPAIVPFDSDNGWYAATRPTLPAFSRAGAFDSSGRIRIFWVCNVGENGRAQFDSGFGDDICERIDLDSNQDLDQFGVLGKSEAQRLIRDAEQAISDAANQFGKCRAGQEGCIRILDERFGLGTPVAESLGTQCQDFMSPGECSLLFNVCDPVVCPSSRCDLGGRYPVADVVQTGVVGSALLCLPNGIAFGGDIAVPVCLTGIKAGIDGYNSILKSHQQCLQENLETGATVGICDEINSVYTCEFFWRQASPIAEALIPAIVDVATGNTQKGGGEYLSVQSAWDNAQGGIDFFTQSYAKNSFEAFQARSVSEAGGQFCQAFISAKAPNIFETLLEADSPVQFHAFFSEIPFSDATVPPTGQYKVFYHIFAGDDQGVGYQVYLKDPPQGSFFGISPRVMVASGFIPRGEFATDTADFTAPSGYKQLCVNINGKEDCGFKQVSTSFLVNSLRDEFVKDEITRNDIASEQECVAGSTSPLALLNPNIQEGLQEAISPEISRRGITRICSTINPGLGTDSLRYDKVGTCGDPKVGCWLDRNSVDDAITNINLGVKAETFVELDKIQKENLVKEGFVGREEGERLLSDISDKFTASKLDGFTKEESDGLIFEIDGLLDGTVEHPDKRLVYNTQKAKAWYLKVLIYAEYFGGVLKGTTSPVEETIFLSDSLIFEFQDGRSLTENLFYRWNGEWQWSFSGAGSWFSTKQIFAGEGQTFFNTPSQKNVEFIGSLEGQTYKEGVVSLFRRTLANKEGGTFDTALVTDRITLNSEGIFASTQSDFGIILSFRFSGIWEWNIGGNSGWISTEVTEVPSGLFEGSIPNPANLNLINSLEGESYEDGVFIMFEQGNIIKRLPEENIGELYEAAIIDAEGRKGKYSDEDNKEFVDNLFDNGLIDEKEYLEINGEGSGAIGWFNFEENMEFVRDLLIEKKRAIFGDRSSGETETKSDGSVDIGSVAGVDGKIGDILFFADSVEQNKLEIPIDKDIVISVDHSCQSVEIETTDANGNVIRSYSLNYGGSIINVGRYNVPGPTDSKYFLKLECLDENGNVVGDIKKIEFNTTPTYEDVP